MKKIILTTVLTGILLTMVGCVKSNKSTSKSKADMTTTSESKEENDAKETTQIANPFETMKTMEEAEKVAGFSMEVPKTINNYDKQIIQVIKSNLIQVTYQKIKVADDEVVIRKSSSTKEDISGHHDAYDEEISKNQSGNEVKLHKKAGKFMIGTWKNDGSTYSVDFQTGTDKETLLEVVNQVK